MIPNRRGAGSDVIGFFRDHGLDLSQLKLPGGVASGAGNLWSSYLPNRLSLFRNALGSSRDCACR